MGPVEANVGLRVLIVGADTVVGASVAARLALRGDSVGIFAASDARTQEKARIAVASALAPLGGLDALVVTSWGPALTAPKAIETIIDAEIEAGWEHSMQSLIWALQATHSALLQSQGRVVVILPTTAMSGGSHYSLAAATFEAQRILMKATARQWGPLGIRVNAVAIAPELVLDDPAAAHVHYLAPAALGDDPADAKNTEDLLGVVMFLIGRSSGGLTGQTLGVDGGRWLAP